MSIFSFKVFCFQNDSLMRLDEIGLDRIGIKTKNPHHLHDEDFKIKTGGDLLSRVSSTIGARGLNFCVRNGNR